MLLRIIRFPLLVVIAAAGLATATTTPIPWLEYWVIKTFHISPWWNSEDLEMYNWNRLVKEVGVKRAIQEFKK
jgi:hypothetical protein